MIRRFLCPVCQCWVVRRDGRYHSHIGAQLLDGYQVKTWTCAGSGKEILTSSLDMYPESV